MMQELAIPDLVKICKNTVGFMVICKRNYRMTAQFPAPLSAVTPDHAMRCADSGIGHPAHMAGQARDLFVKICPKPLSDIGLFLQMTDRAAGLSFGWGRW